MHHIEAMKQVLKATENITDYDGLHVARATLRTAIAEAESRANEKAEFDAAHEALEKQAGIHVSQQSAEKQEPVAWMHPDGRVWTFGRGLDKSTFTIPLYTSPPASKPWVRLTDEEMRGLEKQFNAERVRTSDEEYLIIYPGAYWAWQRAIEAKLKEKNGF